MVSTLYQAIFFVYLVIGTGTGVFKGHLEANHPVLYVICVHYCYAGFYVVWLQCFALRSTPAASAEDAAPSSAAGPSTVDSDDSEAGSEAWSLCHAPAPRSDSADAAQPPPVDEGDVDYAVLEAGLPADDDGSLDYQKAAAMLAEEDSFEAGADSENAFAGVRISLSALDLVKGSLLHKKKPLSNASSPCFAPVPAAAPVLLLQ